MYATLTILLSWTKSTESNSLHFLGDKLLWYIVMWLGEQLIYAKEMWGTALCTLCPGKKVSGLCRQIFILKVCNEMSEECTEHFEPFMCA